MIIHYGATYDDKVYLFDTQRERFEDVFVYHPQIEECDLVEKLIPLNNGIVWVVASDGNLWRIDEADYQKDNGVIFLSSGSVPQHGIMSIQLYWMHIIMSGY